MTEETNRKGVYSTTTGVTEALSGWHHAKFLDGSSNPIASYYVYLADDTNIHRCTEWVDIAAVAGTSQTAGDLGADVAAILVDTGTTLPATLGTPAGADLATDIAAVKTDTAAILVDTNELQGDWTDGGRLDLIIDAILVDTGTTLDTKLNTAQADLDILTGTDGVTLATSQPNYAPATAAALATAQADLDIITGADGVILLSGTQASIDAIETDTNSLNDTKIPDSLSHANLQAQLITTYGLDHLVSASVVGTDIADSSIIASLVSSSATPDWDDFVNTTDSLQAIRDRGDAAWVTATSSDASLLVSTTIATLANQTSFTLTAGSADDNAYNGHKAVVIDSATSTQVAVGKVSDYTGSTRTVTLERDPGIFTMAVGDTVKIVATNPDIADIKDITQTAVED